MHHDQKVPLILNGHQKKNIRDERETIEGLFFLQKRNRQVGTLHGKDDDGRDGDDENPRGDKIALSTPSIYMWLARTVFGVGSDE